MDMHENARTTLRSRMLMAERLRSGWTVVSAAAAAGVDPATVRKWRDRYELDAVQAEVGHASGGVRQ